MGGAVSGDNNATVLEHMQESMGIMQKIVADTVLQVELENICELCTSIYRNGKKILIAGNGGSAADAQHFAGELVSRFYFDRPPLPAIALTTDTSILTAIGNDYGFKNIFSRQILAHGCAGDLFIAISSSGNSENIQEAIETCKSKDMVTIGLTGASGGRMKDLCNHCLCVPSSSTPRIQECHLVIEHTICAYVEQQIFGGGRF